MSGGRELARIRRLHGEVHLSHTLRGTGIRRFLWTAGLLTLYLVCLHGWLDLGIQALLVRGS